MKLVVYLTICFMVFEMLKMTMMKTYWNASIYRDKHPALVILELLYLFFLIALFFMHYWYIGVSVLIVSIITAFQVMDEVMDHAKYNKAIRHYLMTDAIVSIILLSVILIKELLLK